MFQTETGGQLAAIIQYYFERIGYARLIIDT